MQREQGGQRGASSVSHTALAFVLSQTHLEEQKRREKIQDLLRGFKEFLSERLGKTAVFENFPGNNRLMEMWAVKGLRPRMWTN